MARTQREGLRDGTEQLRGKSTFDFGLIIYPVNTWC